MDDHIYLSPIQYKNVEQNIAASRTSRSLYNVMSPRRALTSRPTPERQKLEQNWWRMKEGKIIPTNAEWKPQSVEQNAYNENTNTVTDIKDLLFYYWVINKMPEEATDFKILKDPWNHIVVLYTDINTGKKIIKRLANLYDTYGREYQDHLATKSGGYKLHIKRNHRSHKKTYRKRHIKRTKKHHK